MARPSATLRAAPAPEVPQAATVKPKGKLGLILVIVFVVLGAAGGAGWWFWNEKNSGGPRQAAHKTEPTRPPQFVNIDQFVVNLHGEGVEHYLQVSMVLSVKGNEAAEAIKRYMPVIRDRILLLLASRRAAELTTPGAKEALADEIRKVTRDALPESREGDPDKGIESVLFSGFVIQ